MVEDLIILKEQIEREELSVDEKIIEIPAILFENATR